MGLRRWNRRMLTMMRRRRDARATPLARTNTHHVRVVHREPVAADGAGAAVLHDRGEHPGRGWAGDYRFGALVYAVSSCAGAQPVIRGDRLERAGEFFYAQGA